MTTLPGDDDLGWLAEQLSDLPNDADVVDVTTLDNSALLNLFHECNSELQRLREEMVPRTEQGRSTHSVRASCVITLKERGLL